MGRTPCCEKAHTNKGAWTRDEDQRLVDYIRVHGEGCWRSLPKSAGLLRCGKSCRLRWINYLRPDLKRGNFTQEEDDLIIKLHSLLGNKWSLIAGRLPGRTDNEIKNYWNTHIKRKLIGRGVDPTSHRPINEQNNIAASSDRPKLDPEMTTPSSPPRPAPETESTLFKGSLGLDLKFRDMLSMEEKNYYNCPTSSGTATEVVEEEEQGEQGEEKGKVFQLQRGEEKMDDRQELVNLELSIGLSTSSSTRAESSSSSSSTRTNSAESATAARQLFGSVCLCWQLGHSREKELCGNCHSGNGPFRYYSWDM